MGFGTGIHYIGSFFLLVATALLVVSTISAPVVSDINFLNIDLGDDNGKLTFGVFGHCAKKHGGCSGASIGYDPAGIIDDVENTDFARVFDRATKALTHVFILHPIAAVILFIGFIFSLKTGFLSLVTALVSGIGFILSVICVAIDFATWTLVRREVNKDDNDFKAHYGPAIFLVVGAAVLAFIGTVIILVTCCAGRKKNRDYRRSHTHHKANY